MANLLGKLHTSGALSEAQYQAALAEVLVFLPEGATSPATAR
jgi:hypothetical protein